MELRNDDAKRARFPHGDMAGYAGMRFSQGNPFSAKDPDDARRIDALLQGMRVLARGIAGTHDCQRFLVQHDGAVFNFCLDDERRISHSAVVHPLRCDQSDFLADGGMQPVFLRMSAARQMLEAYLGEQPRFPVPGGAPQED